MILKNKRILKIIKKVLQINLTIIYRCYHTTDGQENEKWNSPITMTFTFKIQAIFRMNLL